MGTTEFDSPFSSAVMASVARFAIIIVETTSGPHTLTEPKALLT